MRSIPLYAVTAGLVAGFIAPAFFPDLRSSSRAGTAVKLSLDEAFLASDLVIEGQVTGATCGTAADGTIYTDWEIDIESTYWGDPQGTRIVRLPGGVLSNGKGMVIPGMPRLVEGEHVILMLEGESRDGMRLPTGLSQGKYRVVTSAEGERTAIRTGDHVSLITARNTRTFDGLDMLDYADLKSRLEALRQERRQRPTGTGR